MVVYADRPSALSGCWSQWSEQDTPQVIRTTMEVGPPKVRRRYTGVHRRANVQVVLLASQLPLFLSWFRVTCKGGVSPTNMIEPDGTESIWRFIEPPTVSWPRVSGEVVTIACAIEQLPGW